MPGSIGILTAGGDSPGLNAAIRAIGKAAQRSHGMHVIGFRDGFRGLIQNRTVRLDSDTLSGILTKGGTILGTSRDKPHKMLLDGKIVDMTSACLETFAENQLDALVCLGGSGTAKNALRLKQRGMSILTLPKTIDNDVWGTDTTFGFDTALNIATEAIDRLHSTAHSHHRIVVVELMGHNAGWLALGAGIAGGADVILIPEIPYDVDRVAASILVRKAGGSSFSIVAVSEGAMSWEEAARLAKLEARQDSAKAGEREAAEADLAAFWADRKYATERLTQELEKRTGLEGRVTILGHVQRGGIPSPADRLLATRLGAACSEYIAAGTTGVMVAARGNGTEPVPLEDVAGKTKTVPVDDPLVGTARRLGISLGD